MDTTLLRVKASESTTRRKPRLRWLPLIALAMLTCSGGGCAFLAGAAVGGAGGYVVGHEAGEDEVREDVARDGDIDDPD